MRSGFASRSSAPGNLIVPQRVCQNDEYLRESDKSLQAVVNENSICEIKNNVGEISKPWLSDYTTVGCRDYLDNSNGKTYPLF
jgi:hypothetical protein